MQSMICPHCSTEFTLENLLKSLSDYGFINLTSEEEEIVAFYCPEKNCGKQLVMKGKKVGLSETIFTMGLSGQAHVCYSDKQFQYYAPFPFTKQNRSFMKSLGVYEERRFDEDEIDTSNFQEFPEDTFVSFNPNYLSLLGDVYHLYWYPKESVEALLKFEDETGNRVFPRYKVKSSIIEKADSFCNEIILREALSEEKELEPIIKFLRESRSKLSVSRMFNFVDLLTPQSSLGKIDNSTLEAFRKSDYIWRKFRHNLLADNIDYKIEAVNNKAGAGEIAADIFTLFHS